MGVYSLDRSSPKKAYARSGFLEVKRKLSNRRYLCLWVFVALVPCYLLRQMFFYQSPSRATYTRDPVEERLTTTAAENTISYEMPSEPKIKEKSVLDFIFKHNTIKPAQYTTVINPTTNKVENVTRNSLKLKLKENFEDDEDFGSAEDNDKAEEQMWTAPPAPALPKK
ncbi:unnamed protein product [Calypogeia fissa]